MDPATEGINPTDIEGEGVNEVNENTLAVDEQNATDKTKMFETSTDDSSEVSGNCISIFQSLYLPMHLYSPDDEDEETILNEALSVMDGTSDVDSPFHRYFFKRQLFGSDINFKAFDEVSPYDVFPLLSKTDISNVMKARKVFIHRVYITA